MADISWEITQLRNSLEREYNLLGAEGTVDSIEIQKINDIQKRINEKKIEDLTRQVIKARERIQIDIDKKVKKNQKLFGELAVNLEKLLSEDKSELKDIKKYKDIEISFEHKLNKIKRTEGDIIYLNNNNIKHIKYEITLLNSAEGKPVNKIEKIFIKIQKSIYEKYKICKIKYKEFEEIRKIENDLIQYEKYIENIQRELDIILKKISKDINNLIKELEK